MNDLAARLGTEYCRDYRLLPIEVRDGAWIVAAAPDASLGRLPEIASICGSAVRRTSVSALEFELLLENVFGDPNALAGGGEAMDLTPEAPPVVAYVDRLLSRAIAEGWTDLHFNRDGGRLEVRRRMHGVLSAAPGPAAGLSDGVFARIKLIAGLDLAETRLPQDGRATLEIEGRRVDVRVASMSTVRGETLAVRFLDPEATRPELDELGIPAEIIATLRELMTTGPGLILFSGPTGSGKTTTQYAMLRELVAMKKRVLSVEDPVEYRMEGVQQVQVNSRAGLTFAIALRSFLRHDPDVILVGEIRDSESARLAVQAAQTGHLVLATVHANTPKTSVERLLDLGVPGFLVAEVLRGALGQRLEPVVCSACEGRGCERCGSEGTVGRRLDANWYSPSIEERQLLRTVSGS